nr:ORF7 [Human gammaherpesvirus 8]
MAKELAAVYADVSALAMDLCLLSYADPATLDTKSLALTTGKFQSLHGTLLPLLRRQNAHECSGLSLELEHLLENVADALTTLGVCTSRKLSPEEHFSLLHLDITCNKHRSVRFNFYGNWALELKLSLINDVEIFFKRLSSVFYCIGSGSALEGLGEVLRFVGKLRGISPVPGPDLYVSNLPCLECLQEVCLTPNQGTSLQAMLPDTACSHICTPACGEPVRGLFENELRQLGLQTPESIPTTPCQSRVRQDDEIRQSSLMAVGDHHIFGEVTRSVLEISNLIYWSSGHSDATCDGDRDCSHLASLFTHEADMHKRRVDLAGCLGERGTPKHFFDCFRPDSLETLFCGGLFSSVEDTIESLQKDCSSAFYQQVNYTTALQKQNEFYVRLSKLLAAGQLNLGKCSTESCPSEARRQLVGGDKPEEVLRDAKHRQELYLQKVARDGFKKLSDCIRHQGHILSQTLGLRLWGSVIYNEASALQNHFLHRAQFISLPWQDLTVDCPTRFENSKYIKNSLYCQRLGREHVEILTLEFYKLITGPLSKRHTLFPSPPNVTLAQCFEAAGMLPHQKMMVSEMIWPSIEPKDWIEPNFNQFYSFENQDINHLQKRAWEYIRELVLSVSLYNRTWERELKILLTPQSSLGFEEPKPAGLTTGLYLTFETSAPLVLVDKKYGWIFKDLYALLYHHLQLSNHNDSQV